MAYSTPSTQVTGYVVLATNWNEFVNNFIAMAPDLFTADGEIHVATAANVGKALLAFTSDLLLHELGAWELDISGLTTNDTVGGASAGVAEIKVPVTQVEAEAGTNTRFSLWSSERVKQAIAALSGSTQADQTALEAETNENTYAPPDLIKHSPGIAKVWVSWTQSGAHAITSSYNMTSVTDGGGDGDTDHLWNVDFSGIVYSVVCSAVTTGGSEFTAGVADGTQAATGVTTITFSTSGAPADQPSYLAGFGDQ